MKMEMISMGLDMYIYGKKEEDVKKFCDICKVLLNVKDVECEYESNYVDKKVKE